MPKNALFEQVQQQLLPELQSLDNYLDQSEKKNQWDKGILEATGEKELSFIDAINDRNCGPRAVIQAILLDGLSETDKKAHIAYLTGLFKRQNGRANAALLKLAQEKKLLDAEGTRRQPEYQKFQKSRKDGTLWTKEQFSKFIQAYSDCAHPSDVSLFSKKYFRFNPKSGCQDDIPVFYLAACLRFDIGDYWNQEGEVNKCNNINTIDKSVYTDEFAQDYFINQGINFDCILKYPDSGIFQSSQKHHEEILTDTITGLNQSALKNLESERLNQLKESITTKLYTSIEAAFLNTRAVECQNAKDIVHAVKAVLKKIENSVHIKNPALQEEIYNLMRSSSEDLEEQRIIAIWILSHKEMRTLDQFQEAKKLWEKQNKWEQDIRDRQYSATQALEEAIGGPKLLQERLKDIQPAAVTKQAEEKMKKLLTQLEAHKKTQGASITCKILNRTGHYVTVVTNSTFQKFKALLPSEVKKAINPKIVHDMKYSAEISLNKNNSTPNAYRDSTDNSTKINFEALLSKNTDSEPLSTLEAQIDSCRSALLDLNLQVNQNKQLPKVDALPTQETNFSLPNFKELLPAGAALGVLGITLGAATGPLWITVVGAVVTALAVVLLMAAWFKHPSRNQAESLTSKSQLSAKSLGNSPAFYGAHRNDEMATQKKSLLSAVQ